MALAQFSLLCSSKLQLLFSRIQLHVNFAKSAGIRQEFHTEIVKYGKKNFRKFQTFNKRGTLAHRKKYQYEPLYDLGVRETGVRRGNVFVPVPEMVPDFIVPDLTGFELKPYVSYRVPDVVQSRFTAKDLFDACYLDKIVEDFQHGKLADDGSPLEPSENEKTNSEEARIRARQTGSDLF